MQAKKAPILETQRASGRNTPDCQRTRVHGRCLWIERMAALKKPGRTDRSDLTCCLRPGGNFGQPASRTEKLRGARAQQPEHTAGTASIGPGRAFA